MWGYKRPLYIHSYYQFNTSIHIPPMYIWLYIYMHKSPPPPPPPPPARLHIHIYPISLIPPYPHMICPSLVDLSHHPPPTHVTQHPLPFQPVFPGPTPLAFTTPLLPSPCSHDPSILWCLSVTTSNPYSSPIFSFPSTYSLPPIISYLPKVLMLVTIL